MSWEILEREMDAWKWQRGRGQLWFPSAFMAGDEVHRQVDGHWQGSWEAGRIQLLDLDCKVFRTLLFTCSHYPGSARLPLLQLESQITWFVKQSAGIASNERRRREDKSLAESSLSWRCLQWKCIFWGNEVSGLTLNISLVGEKC